MGAPPFWNVLNNAGMGVMGAWAVSNVSDSRLSVWNVEEGGLLSIGDPTGRCTSFDDA